MSSFPWIKAGVPALVLAPMEGVTDAPMRDFLGGLGGFSFCVSEFLRISQDPPPIRTFLEHVPELAKGAETPSGIPVQVQLLGGDPEKLKISALRAIQAGAQAIDLNFGCPAPTVNRHDGGATLLKFPERIREIVRTLRDAVPKDMPVSAKLRLGWEDPRDIIKNAKMAAEGGANWLTIHARTRMQGYQPPVYWRPIAEVRKEVGIPVVANGDIWSLADFVACQSQSGAEHFMLGRGAMADPTLPAQIAAQLGALTGGEAASGLPMTENAQDWLPYFKHFAKISASASRSPGYTVSRIKQWVKLARIGRKAVVSAPEGWEAFPWFESIKQLSNLEEIFACLEKTTPERHPLISTP